MKVTTKEIMEVQRLALDGLMIDGGHHKQWFLEKILLLLGVTEKDLNDRAEKGGYERGIAP